MMGLLRRLLGLPETWDCCHCGRTNLMDDLNCRTCGQVRY